MAAMLPSASTSSQNPYDAFDNDAVERDLIDPDDGKELPSEDEMRIRQDKTNVYIQ